MEIQARLVITQRPKLELDSKFKNLRSYVNNYVHERMDNFINRFIVTTAIPNVYTSVRERTGGLGKSITPINKKVNQYATNYGLYFDPAKTPYVGTHVGRAGSYQTITSKNKLLTIPHGTLANLYNPRPRVADYRNRLVRIGFPSGKAVYIWKTNADSSREYVKSGKYKGKNKRKHKINNEDIAFIAVPKVRVKRMVHMTFMNNRFVNDLKEQVQILTESALQNFRRIGGGWIK